MRIRSVPNSKTYVFEFNRPLNNDYRRILRRLERAGLEVDRLEHKTTFRIRRQVKELSWPDFRDLLASLIDSRLGSLLLVSLSTGRAWIMCNRGNRRRRLVRIDA